MASLFKNYVTHIHIPMYIYTIGESIISTKSITEQHQNID